MMKKDVLIIGAGLSGLSTAFFLQEKNKDVLVAESSRRTGGSIRSFSENGYIYESGPNTGTLSSPEIAELFEKLGNSCKMEIANRGASRRLILKNGRLEALPSGCISGLSSKLFTWKDKFKLLREPFVAGGKDPMESVASMVRRRMGNSYLDYAVDPFISGIYAGDPEALVTRYALPKLYALEQNYGSFIRGAVAKARIPKTERDLKATKEIFSVKGGLGNLTAALAAKVGEGSILTDMREIRIEKKTSGTYLVKLQGLEVETPCIVSTVGAYALPSLFGFLPGALMEKISNLRYAPVIQVSVGIRKNPFMDLNAFGALFPGKEKRPVLGILYPSSCFSGRAPEGYALLSFFIGGIRNPGLFSLSDEEIEKTVKNELKYVYRSDSPEIEFIRIFRHRHAIPQYDRTCGERLKAIDAVQKLYPGILLAGNIRDGIGMSDRVKQAFEIAGQIGNEHKDL